MMSWTTHPVDHIMDPWIHSSCVLRMVMPRVRVLEAKQHGLRVRRSIYAALHSSGSPRAPMDPSIHPSTSGWTHRESLCLSVVTRHPNRMYRDLHGVDGLDGLMLLVELWTHPVLLCLRSATCTLRATVRALARTLHETPRHHIELWTS